MNVFFQKSNKTHQKPEKAPGGLDQPAAIFGGGAPRENDLSFNFFLKKGSTKAIVIFITAVIHTALGMPETRRACEALEATHARPFSDSL